MDIQPIVSILDDDDSVVQALGRLLRAEGFVTHTWTCATEFLAAHDPTVPGCLVCDLIMPDMSGLELQRALSAGDRARPIIFVTARGDISTTVQGMRAGAVTFLPKPVRRAELVAAVREAIARDAAARSVITERRRVREMLDSLTPRERQVLELVVTGMLNKQIAARLGTAVKTIKVHRGRLMDKMHVRSAAALVQLLVSAEIAPPAARLYTAEHASAAGA